MFIAHDGNKFQMYRENHLEEYQKYNVSEQLETEWFNELIEHYSQKLSIKDWEALFRLDSIASNYKHEKILKNVLSFASRNVMSSDSIVKLMYAEKIIEIIRKTKELLHNDLRIEAYKTTFILLEDIINKPLILDPGHKLEHCNLKDKKSLNDRAKRSIDEIRKDLS